MASRAALWPALCHCCSTARAASQAVHPAATAPRLLVCQEADETRCAVQQAFHASLFTFLPPLQGRIFVLAASGGKLNIVCEKETRGAVYALTEFQGRLLAGINSRVQMYK